MKLHDSATNTQENTQGTLFIVATPIGNLSDITQRALTVLQEADLLAVEDTRHTGQLLQHFTIRSKMLSLHTHNEQQQSALLLEKLRQGLNIALVSDAGTPLINDPGFQLVRACHQAGIRVSPVPGCCAAIAALSVSGLPADRFCYEGFLPAKSKARRDTLQALQQESRTLIFYESPHRLTESLNDMCQLLGAERYIVLARELTKTWESIYGASAAKLLDWINEDTNRHRGEMVLIVEGARPRTTELPAEALHTLALLRSELPLKKAATLAAEIHGVKKNALYDYALSKQSDNE